MRDAHKDALVKEILFVMQWVTHGTTGEAFLSAKDVKFLSICSVRAMLLQVRQREGSLVDGET